MRLVLVILIALTVPARADTPAQAWARHELGLDGAVPPQPDDMPPLGYIPPPPLPVQTSPLPPTWLQFGVPGWEW